MLTTIRRFLAPPVFPGDEEKTRAASLVNTIFISLTVFIAFMLVAGIAGGLVRPTTYLFLSVFILTLVGLQIPLRRGEVKLASTLFVILFIPLIAATLATTGTARAPGLIFFIFASIITGLVISRRAAIVVSVINVGIVAGLIWAESNGLLPTPLGPSVAQVITFTLGSLFTVILVNLALQSIDNALEQARHKEQEIVALVSTLEERVVERTRALSASMEISRRLSTILDPNQLILEVVEQVKAAYDYYHAHIYLLDESGQKLRMVGGTGTAGQTLLEHGHTIPLGMGVVGRSASLRQGILVPDTSKEENWLANPLLPHTRAEIAVPILLHDQVIGVLDVQDDVIGDVFPEDVELLQSIANQVAVAWQNARQYEEARQLFEGGQALAAANDQQQMLEIFMTFGAPQADHGGLLLFNTLDDGTLLSVEYAAAWSPHSAHVATLPVGTYFAPEQLPFLASLLSDQSFTVTHINQPTLQAQTLSPEASELLTQFGLQSLATLPLRVGEKRLGALLFGYVRPHTFTQRELQPSQILAGQMAILLQNQQLLAETQSTLTQLDIVNRRLVRQGWQEFTQTRGNFTVEDASPQMKAFPNHMGTPLEITMPITVQGETIGHFQVQHSEAEHDFSPEDVALLREVATEVAVALENIRLIEQTQQNAAALEESRNLLDSIIENLPLLLFVKDAQELRYLRWNKAGEELLGISAEEVLGKNAYDSFPPEEAERFTRQDRDILSGMSFLDVADETVTTPYGVRLLHTRKTPVYGPDGQAKYLIGLSEDITERKKAETALQDLEALYRRAIAAADAVPYSRRYQDETYSFVGEGIEMLTGYPVAEFSARIFDTLIQENIIHSVQQETHADAVRQTRAGKVAHWKADYRIHTRTGEERWLADTSVEVLGPDGTSVGSVGILTDITERKRAEQTLNRQLLEMEALNAVGQILTTQTDLQEMLLQVGQQICAIFNVNTGYIALYEPRSQMLNTPFALHLGTVVTIPAQPLRPGLVTQIIQSRQPRLIANMQAKSPVEIGINIVADALAACWLGVPILSSDQVLGFISLQHPEQPNWLKESDMRLLSTIATNLSTAIQNIRLFEQTQNALTELEMLTRRLTQEGWHSYLADASQERLAYLFEGDRTIHLPENGSARPPVPNAHNKRSFVQPVTVHGESIGQLIATDVDIDDDESQAILMAVSHGLSTHLDNLRLNEQTERALAEARRRSTELNVLNEMGRALTGANNIEEIVQHLHTYLPQLVPADDYYIAFNHAERNEIEIRVFVNNEPYSHFTRETGNGITEYLLRSRQPLFMHENIEEIAREKGFEIIGRLPHAYIGVPMIVGADALGVIAIQTEEETYLFNESHLELLVAVASQMAIAISNVYLLTQTQARAEELSIINRVVSSVASSLDIRQSMQIVATELARVARVEQTGIALFNAEHTHLTVVAELYDPNVSESAIGFVIPVAGNLSTQEVMRTRKPLVIADPQTSPLTAPIHEGLKTRNVQSITIFPMIVGNELIGTIGIDILEAGRVLTTEQTRLVETIVYQAAIAVDNARLFDQTEQALAEARTLYEVSTQLNAARTLPEALLALTQPAMEREANATGLFTFELDDAGQPEWGVVAAAWQRDGYSAIPIGNRFYVPDFPLAHLWLTDSNHVLFLEDMSTDSRVDEAIKLLGHQLSARATIWIPLTAQSRWLGVAYITWDKPHQFTLGERRLYEALRTQGSTIVENRLLYEQSQARAAELGVINQVAETVARQLDPEQVMESVYHQVQRVMVADAFLIGLYDPDKDIISYPILYDNGQRYKQEPLARTPQSYIFQVIDTGQPVYVNLSSAQLEQSREVDPTVGDTTAFPASVIYVPLFSGTQVMGAMSVQSYQTNAYDDGDLTLLIGIASHVAVALENARLFAQTQERAAELATINEMNQIASSQLSLSGLVRAVGAQLERTFQADGVYVALHEPEKRRITFPYFMETDEGVRKFLDMAPRDLDGPGVTGRIIKSRQSILVTQDTEAQMLAMGAAMTASGPKNVQAYLGVPMIVGDEVVGVIAVQNDVGKRMFNEADQRLLLTLASSIGVAIQNAQQYEITRRRAQRERLLNEITQKIQGTHTLEGALQTAVNELGQALKAKYAWVEIAAAPDTPTNGKSDATTESVA